MPPWPGLALLLPLLWAAPQGWTPVAARDGVRVYQRRDADAALPTFLATIEVSAPIARVLALVEDGAGHRRWFHNTVDSRVIRRRPDTFVVYHHLHSPPPVADREVYLQVRRLPATAAGVVRFEFRALPMGTRPVPRDRVRITRLQGTFELTPAAPGRTRVRYQVAVDPGGRLPPWMARRGTRDMPLYTLLNLRDLLRSG